MRNSNILKWGNNNKNNKLSLGSGGKNNNPDKSGNNKNWIHSPDTLLNGHVVYLVKFLGDIEVDQPKGIEVVKQGVQKLKFNQQLKKAESGSSNSKMPKAELTISVNGVTIIEPKTKNVLHEYPLHRISYCADDKAEKRFFSFIAKDADSNRHTCFVFLSDKLAEEITLTVGQAFELAYKKFLESKGKDLEKQKESMVMQKRIELLENENKELKKRLTEVANIKGDNDVKQYMRENNISELCVVPTVISTSESSSTNNFSSDQDQVADSTSNGKNSDNNSNNGDFKDLNSVIQSTMNSKSVNELICLDDSNTSSQVDFGGITLNNFTLDDLDDDEFNPRAVEQSQPANSANIVQVANVTTTSPAPAHIVPAALVPPPALPPREFKKVSPVPENNNNPFSDSFSTNSGLNDDPFGMSTFSSAPAIAKPAVNPHPLASLDDLDPFKNI
jgi:hypothetical protein